ncbi:reverse transcriptase-like protein [Bacillus cereus]|uniref:reverse transcriptase-like protein n=1 Tax=Bacillus cereus TaxID=1396 RepID=UPI003D174279
MHNCYCDASYNELEQVSQVGIVIYDEFGNAIYNKTKRPNKIVINTHHAELLAVLESLIVIRDMKLTDVLIHSDNQDIVEKVTKKKEYKNNATVLNPLLDNIRQKLDQSNSTLMWVNRDENAIADDLSKGVRNLRTPALNGKEFDGKLVATFKGKKRKTHFSTLRIEQIIKLQDLLKKAGHENIEMRLKEHNRDEITVTKKNKEELSIVV